MPIDIVGMTKDPDFLTLSPDAQRQLILTARQHNAGGRPAAPAAPPGAFPWGGGTTGVSTPEEAEASVAAIRDRVARGVADQRPSDLTIDIDKTSPPAHWTSGLIDPLEPYGAQAAQRELQRPAPLPVPPDAAIAALPGMAGYALGARVAPLLRPVGKVLPPLLEAGGSYLGRKANVALGYEPPGTVGDIASAAVPLGIRGTTGAVGSMFERALNQAGTPFLNRLLSRFGPGVSVGVLLHSLMGDPSVATMVGGSIAGLRLFLDGVAATPWGTKVLTSVLATGRQLAGPELSALVQVGRVKLAQKLAQMQETGQMRDSWNDTFPSTASDAP